MPGACHGPDVIVSKSLMRVVFWTAGTILAIFLAYTTRYYVNSDAMAYIEMGELFANGVWSGLVNLTFSPAYPVVLAAAQKLLGTSPINEIIWLKTVNVLWFALAMLGADLMISSVRTEIEGSVAEGEAPLAAEAFTALSYAMFLVTALALIRVQLMNPDMAVLFIVSCCVTIILWIRRSPDTWVPYVLLGVAVGVGYLLKAFFFVFAVVVLAVSLLVSESPWRSVRRVAVAVLVYAAIVSPLVFALSMKKGGLTYGEGGRHVYVVEVGGEGEPLYHPQVLTDHPRVVLFDEALPSTRPYSFDVTYWTVGIRPAYRILDYAAMILSNIEKIFSQDPWLILVTIWLVVVGAMGSIRIRPFRPLSPALVLLIPAVGGIGLFCLIRMEPRYIAPFLFVGLVGLLAALRFPVNDLKARHRSRMAAWMLLGLLLTILMQSAVDQSHRGLFPVDGKLSRRGAYLEQVAVKKFLSAHGLRAGDRVAVLGNPPLYWARLCGVKIVGEIPDPNEFLIAGAAARARSIDALRAVGLKAIVSRGSAPAKLAGDGWLRIPGTTSYHALLLTCAR
jgi:hypothetical protein